MPLLAMAQHAILSPSAAHRWLHCTAAPRLEERMPDEGSEFAREGTVAHALCAKMIKEQLGRDYSAEAAELSENAEIVTGEMAEHAQAYRDIVFDRYGEALRRDATAVLLVETELDISDYAPECFGTADAMIVTHETVEVIDFKYGKGVPVSAVGNEQMRLYALGAMAYYYGYDFRTVTMTIVQPRLGEISSDTMTADDLHFWGKSIAAAAKEAYEGPGKQRAGDWCKFCKVRGSCKALASLSLDTYDKARGMTLGADDLAAVLPKLPLIKLWVSEVEEQALRSALDGTAIPGYKVVHGRSVRRIEDPQAVAFELLAAGYDDVWKPTDLKTITELEKQIGKKRFGELCGKYITKPEGKPTLAPESDMRPAIDQEAEMFDGF